MQNSVLMLVLTWDSQHKGSNAISIMSEWILAFENVLMFVLCLVAQYF